MGTVSCCKEGRRVSGRESVNKFHIKLLGLSSDSILGNRIKGFGGITSSKSDGHIVQPPVLNQPF